MTDPTGPPAPTKPHEPSGLLLTLKIEEATWGDLRYYVNALRDIPDDAPLGLDIDDDPYGEGAVLVGLVERASRATL